MALIQTCLAGIATSVLAAGLVTANSHADHEQGVPPLPGIELTASTIPIIDFTGSLGPLTVTRKLTLGLDDPPNLLVGLTGEADTAWAASVGPIGELKNSFALPVTQTSTATMVDLGFEPDVKSSMMFAPFGAGGTAIDLKPELKSTIHLIQYRGGVDGYGFGLTGSLLQPGLQGGSTQPTSMVGGTAILGAYELQLSVIPFTGLKAGASWSPYAGGGGGSIQLGTVKIGTTLPSGQVKIGSKLCLGSAAASCGGVIAQAALSAMLGGTALAINGTDVVSYDFPDALQVELTADSLAVTGNVGGTVKVGQVTVGKVIPVNVTIPIPSAPSLPSAGGLRKPQSAAAAQDTAAPLRAPSAAASGKSVTHDRPQSRAAGTAKPGAKTARPARD